jgi:hypothetical protein
VRCMADEFSQRSEWWHRQFAERDLDALSRI